MKKLNWFQRNVLCMNIDIRKEQYTAYKDRRQLAHDQQLILHHASGSAAPADLTAPLSYAQWNQCSMAPWSQIESDLVAAPTPRVRLMRILLVMSMLMMLRRRWMMRTPLLIDDLHGT